MSRQSQDYQDYVVKEFLFPHDIEPTINCKTCKHYKKGACKKQKFNNIAPFTGIFHCWQNCNLKEKIVLLISSTVTFVN